MKESDMELLHKDLEAVVIKWGLKNGAFCASDNEDHFYGTQVGETTVKTFWETALNVGRLWQHMRGEVRRILNDYEPKRDW